MCARRADLALVRGDSLVNLTRTPDRDELLNDVGPVIGRTTAEAEEKFRAIGELVDVDTALAYLGRFFQDIDWSGYDLDGPFPELGDTGKSGWQSASDGIKKRAKKEGMTLRDAPNYQDVGYKYKPRNNH